MIQAFLFLTFGHNLPFSRLDSTLTSIKIDRVCAYHFSFFTAYSALRTAHEQILCMQETWRKRILEKRLISTKLEHAGCKKIGIHVGFKENNKPKIFDSVTKPTKETHPQYDIVYGLQFQGRRICIQLRKWS